MDGNDVLRNVTVPIDDVDVRLAYAMSIHKSQGSEYPCAIIILPNAGYTLLERRLFYTAVTRAKSLCMVMAEDQALDRSLHHREANGRRTMLPWLDKPID
jgi:exodeoxyribonuclease V alpha subunit